ncbi:MAG TPA: TorF family putative porin [Rubrivivax sp.]|nr:TorF family putative porin [Burkholderiales bacterium]HNT39588.1 TorF family putative porin [Rubrivivax sp.]
MKSLHSSSAALLLLFSLAVPTGANAELDFNLAVVSDYRFRGLSQSRLRPAVQGGVDYSAGGLYVGAWGSSIQWIRDAGGDGRAEIDLYGGIRGEFAPGLSWDFGLLRYQYIDHALPVSPNTTEVYAALGWGVATLKVSHSLRNLFGTAGSKGSTYVDLSAGFDLGDGLTLTPHLGYQKVAHHDDLSYADVAIGLSKDFGGFSLSAGAVHADVKKPGGIPVYASPKGRSLGRTALTLGLTASF